MPVGKSVKCGVWEDNKFVGAVIFSQGNNLHIGAKFGLGLFSICELTRVALAKHNTEVSSKMCPLSIREKAVQIRPLRSI